MSRVDPARTGCVLMACGLGIALAVDAQVLPLVAFGPVIAVVFFLGLEFALLAPWLR